MFSSSAVRRPQRTALSAAGALLAGLVLGTVPTADAVAVPAARAETSATTLQRGLDRLVDDGAPGALLYTYDHGQVTALQSGLADIAAERPMGPQDRYRIGSLTKTYVSTAVLQLVAKHRVDLAAPVSRYLPGLMGGAPRITIRQLLNHTSGLYEFNDDPRVLAPYLAGDLGHVWSPRRLVRLALTYDLAARPGSAYHYSNTNYLLAGLVVQAVTGHRLGDVLRSSRVRAGGVGGDDLHALTDVARSRGARVLRLLRRRRADRSHVPLPVPVGLRLHGVHRTGRRPVLPEPARRDSCCPDGSCPR